LQNYKDGLLLSCGLPFITTVLEGTDPIMLIYIKKIYINMFIVYYIIYRKHVNIYIYIYILILWLLVSVEVTGSKLGRRNIFF